MVADDHAIQAITMHFKIIHLMADHGQPVSKRCRIHRRIHPFAQPLFIEFLTQFPLPVITS